LLSCSTSKKPAQCKSAAGRCRVQLWDSTHAQEIRNTVEKSVQRTPVPSTVGSCTDRPPNQAERIYLVYFLAGKSHHWTTEGAGVGWSRMSADDEQGNQVKWVLLMLL